MILHTIQYTFMIMKNHKKNFNWLGYDKHKTQSLTSHDAFGGSIIWKEVIFMLCYASSSCRAN